ncbi:MAG: hypothetical protein QM784_15890 [Polyangiaceae bacterium]
MAEASQRRIEHCYTAIQAASPSPPAGLDCRVLFSRSCDARSVVAATHRGQFIGPSRLSVGSSQDGRVTPSPSCAHRAKVKVSVTCSGPGPRACRRPEELTDPGGLATHKNPPTGRLQRAPNAT